MRHSRAAVVLALAVVLSVSFTLAQQTAVTSQEMATARPNGQPGETTKPIEPDLLGAVFYLDSPHHTIEALPKEEWKAVGKAKMGWTTTHSVGSIQLSGTSSSFRVPRGDESEFVFKVEHPDNVKLYECSQNAEKGVRQFDVVKITNGRTSTREPLSGISVEIVKYGESSYKLAAKHLASGEYAISTGQGVYSFSIQ